VIFSQGEDWQYCIIQTQVTDPHRE